MYYLLYSDNGLDLHIAVYFKVPQNIKTMNYEYEERGLTIPVLWHISL